MKYPTLKEVNRASREEICRWWRFLPSPGTDHVNENREEFNKNLIEEVEIQKAISQRFKELGGFKSEISKKIGWNQQ